MNILLLGSGGREHTLAWKIKQSPHCKQLFIAPGNAGTALVGTNLPIPPTDFENIATACLKHDIQMVVVGPEEPLVKGIYDYFKNNKQVQHIPVIGPSADAAQLEGSKAYAKAFMKRHHIPTAAYREFTADNYEEGVAYINTHSLPIVLKADGLAAGKGVVICESITQALSAFESMIKESKFGDAGKKVVVEEFLTGIELSVFVLTDGKDYLLLPEAKDYKRIGEGDTGLNTGGMGAVSPVPFADANFMQKVIQQIIKPTVQGLQQEQLEYKGFIFFGLINVKDNPFVIEYNCRLGDPETEVVIPRIKNDFIEMLLATSQQRINEIKIDIDKKAAAAIVAVSGGYPGDFEKGKIINGLTTINKESVFVFHAGTSQSNNHILTNGGRVLAVTSLANTIQEASTICKSILEEIHFENMYFRKDIGYEFKSH